MSYLPPPDNAPLFTWGSVDVTALDTKAKIITVRVHVTCWPQDLETPTTKTKVAKSINAALNYFESEGIIPTRKGYKVGVDVVGHSPKESDSSYGTE